MRESQRFNVKLTLVEPPNADEEIKLHGVETFDLQPGLTKEYKFNVYAYREGTALAQLVLTNQKTEEFLCFEVAFKFVAPETIGLISLSAACRQTATHPISVVNPLSSPASFRCESSHPDVHFLPPTLTLPPGAESTIDVVFRPVLAGQGQATLRLCSAELGDYPYTLQYDARPAGLERTIVFKAPLGSTDTVQSFKFLHLARRPAAYAARIEAAPGHRGPAGDFVVESREIRAGAAGEEGVEVAADVRFQPSTLGEARAVLVLSSPEGGDYKALLVGYAQPPQPQGPVVIQSGKAGSVEFYNPFDEAVEYSIQVDNPVFLAGSRTFRLDPKKNHSIAVQFKSDKPQGGRLIVSAPKVTTPWIFFLKGTTQA
uniref:Uncharacterized protein n=1 Tax=Pyrodinium bahamense TaxID=73915 RepID=A0A7S0B324_9DINO